MNGFERRKEKKSNDILQAGLSLFMKYGIKKVSISEIAKEAQVSQVTIYNYFGNKDQLIDEVISYYVDSLWAEYDRIINSDLDYKEKIKQITFNKAAGAEQINEEIYNRIMEDFKQNKGALKNYQEKSIPMLMNFFNQGKESGYIDTSISNEAIMIYVQMFTEYMQKEEVYKNILPFTEDLVKLFFYGIFGEEK
ncbi:TetR family transcriptional regulator [Bacillaceae bacterium W0354]